MSRPQNSFWTLPNPKSSLLGSQKVKNYLKIKSKSKVTIEGNIENIISSTTWVNLKTVFDHTLTPKVAHFCTKKPQNEARFRQKTKVMFEGMTENRG